MSKKQEFKLSVILLLIGIFFLGGCFFSKKNTVTFKTNGGSEVSNISVKSGNKIETPKAPTKAGYVFDGWYSGKEEFNFDEEINEDITLVAKWKKAEIVEEPVVEETTTVQVTKTKKSTKKKTVKKVTAKKKKASNKIKTTKKTKLSKKVTEVQNTVNTATTQDVINTTTTVITTTSEVITTTSQVVTTEVIDNKYFKIERDEDPTYNIIINSNNIKDNSNVELKISEEEFIEFIKTNYNEWYILSDNGSVLTIAESEDKYTISGATEKANSISIEYNNKSIVLYEENGSWVIARPEVVIINGLNIKYFKDLETAIKNYQDGDTIKLLKDVTIDRQIIVDKYINIDGNDFTINSNLEDYLFKVENLSDATQDIMIKNLKVNCNSFINIDDAVLINTIDLDNSVIVLNNNGVLSNNDSLIINGDIKYI